VGVLTEFESDLAKVPGVRRVRVVGEDEPAEIHIVASSDRSPKQVVRDVLSLAKAGHGLAIDHRIVSVVQLEDAAPASTRGNGSTPIASTSPGSRPVISHVILVNDSHGRRVDLGLEWPDGTTSGAAMQLGGSSQARARAGTDVMVQAINDKVRERGLVVDVDDVFVVRTADATETITVRLLLHERGGLQRLTGAADCEGDVVSGAARATLHALNRKLSEI